MAHEKESTGKKAGEKKKLKLSKAAKRDIRDNASAIMTGVSTAVGIAALIIALNERPEDDTLYSELMGPIKR